MTEGTTSSLPQIAAPPLDPAEQRYRLALRAANDIIWDWDARTDASVWGGAMFALLGHDPQEAARAPEGAYAWWVDHLHPEDRERVVAAYDRALASGAAEWAVEYRFRRADGSYAVFHDRACIARDESGAVTRVVGAMHDVSALDRLRRLHAISAALGDAKTEAEVIAVVVEQARAALGAAGGIFGLVRHDAPEPTMEIVGAAGYPPAVNVNWRRFPLAIETPMSQVARTGEALFLRSAEERAMRFPEFVRALPTSYASVAVLPVLVDGAAEGAVALRFDVPQQFPTEDREFLAGVAQQCAQALVRARLYDAERAARAEAERANRAKMDFLATMSHELRTPLNAIAGYAELLELGIRGPLTAEQMKDVGRIRHSQRHLLGLINDVLHYAKIEAGRITTHPEPLLVRLLLAELESLIAPQLGAKRLAFSWTCDDALLVAWADEDKVRQILVNLLGNATKFTPPNGRVHVSAAASERGVCIRVADTGVGIAPADRERIFDPFVQLDRGLANPVEGTGLGLAISRDLARAMGGELAVESELGVGSTFVLELPVA